MEALITPCSKCGRRFDQFKIHELLRDEENRVLCIDCQVPIYVDPPTPEKYLELLARKERQGVLSAQRLSTKP
jgi:hypothetical protein